MNIHSHYSSLHYASPLASGGSPAGLESADSKNSSFKPVEQLAAAEKNQPQARNVTSGQARNRAPDEKPEADEPESNQSSEKNKARAQQQEERETVRRLAARDREVRAHEQAHAAVGGQYAGGARYQFERGPDGINYAVGGEVSIDVSKASTPAQTIAKAQTIRRAALAPAEPSPQDMRVAAQATLLENEARQELAASRVENTTNEAEKEESANEASISGQKSEITAPGTNQSKPDSDTTVAATANTISSRGTSSLSYPISVESRLSQGIANTNLSNRTGNLLDQIA